MMFCAVEYNPVFYEIMLFPSSRPTGRSRPKNEKDQAHQNMIQEDLLGKLVDLNYFSISEYYNDLEVDIKNLIAGYIQKIECILNDILKNKVEVTERYEKEIQLEIEGLDDLLSKLNDLSKKNAVEKTLDTPFGQSK